LRRALAWLLQPCYLEKRTKEQHVGYPFDLCNPWLKFLAADAAAPTTSWVPGFLIRFNSEKENAVLRLQDGIESMCSKD
jgi:hypothetical protein